MDIKKWKELYLRKRRKLELERKKINEQIQKLKEKQQRIRRKIEALDDEYLLRKLKLIRD